MYTFLFVQDKFQGPTAMKNPNQGRGIVTRIDQHPGEDTPSIYDTNRTSMNNKARTEPLTAKVLPMVQGQIPPPHCSSNTMKPPGTSKLMRISW